VIPLQAGLATDDRRELMITWGAVVLVLLIGCVNIAGLLLARSGARAREIATRMALGGSRGAIVASTADRERAARGGRRHGLA